MFITLQYVQRKKLHFLHLILKVRRLDRFSCTGTCTGVVRHACSCALANRYFAASKPPLCSLQTATLKPPNGILTPAKCHTYAC